MRPRWQGVVALLQRLLSATDIQAQQALIVRFTRRSLRGRTTLWLNPIWESAIEPAQSHMPPVPPTELMRRTLITRRAQFQGPAHAPHAVAVPILFGDAVLGVLEVNRDPGDAFDANDRELLRAIGASIAVGLRASHQLEAERRRTRQLELVRSVSAQVAAVLDVDELSHQIVTRIRETFNYYYVALFLLEPGTHTLSRRASAAAKGVYTDTVLDKISLGEGLIGYAAQSGQEILANDVTSEPRYRHVDVLPYTRAEIVLPVRIGDRLLGVLDVQSERRNAFDETDVLVLRALADNLAIALEHARLYGDLKRRAEQLSTIGEISQAIVSILDPDTLYGQIVTSIHERLGYQSVHLFTIDPARRKIIHRVGRGPQGQHLTETGIAYDLEPPRGIITWVARHNETVLANDVHSDPRFDPSEGVKFGETRAELVIPLTFGQAVLGVLDIRSDRTGAFTEDDRALCETLARSIAVAVRNATLYHTERWRRQVTDSLREVVGLLSANLSLDEVLDAVLTQIERILPCQVAAIWLLRGNALCLSAVHGAPTPVCTIAQPDLEGSWLYQALHADGPTIRTPDTPPEPIGSALEFPIDYSAIAAPMRIGERPPLGLLVLLHSTPGRYGREARLIVTAFASSAAVAIENTRLYRSAQEQARISTVMLEIARATQALNTPQEVLSTIVQQMPSLVGVNRCAIMLWDEEGQVFVPAATYGVVGRDNGPPLTLPSRALESILDHNWNTPQPIPLTDKTETGIPVTLRAVLSEMGFVFPVLAPLRAHDRLLGILVVERSEDDRTQPTRTTTSLSFEEWLAVVAGIANQTSAAIETVQLRQAQQEEAYRSQALLQVAQAISRAGNLQSALQDVIQMIPFLTETEWCVLFQWDSASQAFRPTVAYGFSAEREAHLATQRYGPGTFMLLDRVREQAYPILLRSLTESERGSSELFPPAFLQLLPEVSVTSLEKGPLLAVPLLAGGEPLGVLVVKTSSGARMSSSLQRQIELFTGIAEQLAIAIQNDRLNQEITRRIRLEEELQLAREIQQSLIPIQLPTVTGWEIAGLCRPARLVGGDFYDAFTLPSRQLGLVIADVADKGMPAALFMALTRSLVRAFAMQELSPAQVLTRVNDLMEQDARHGMFVTAIYGTLATDHGTFRYANAGHTQPLLWRADHRQTERLPKGDIALGVTAPIAPTEHTVLLHPGDTLILYTDGVTEAFDPVHNRLYGETGLVQTIQAYAHLSTGELLEHIVEAVDTHLGGAYPSDDITLLIIRRTG